MPTLYETLGVESNASSDEIRLAHREKAKAYHPDRVYSLGEKLRGVADEEMKKINQAWEILGDPQKRAAYDRELAETSRPSSWDSVQATDDEAGAAAQEVAAAVNAATSDVSDTGGDDQGSTAGKPRDRNIGQSIALASWRACFVAIVLGLLSNWVLERQGSLAVTVSYVTMFLMLAGLVLGLGALAGMRKWGRDDVLRPALVGLIMSVCLIVSVLSGMASSRRQQLSEQQARQEKVQELEQQERAAFLSAGWLGIYPRNPVILTISSMPPENPIYAGLLSNLSIEAAIAQIGVQNVGKTEVVVDTAGAVATLSDGAQVTSLDMAQVLKSAKSRRDELMRAYSPPLRVSGSAAGFTLLLFPAGTDWRRVHTVTMKVDGVSQVVPGQFLSAEQKQQLTQVASRPAPQAP